MPAILNLKFKGNKSFVPFSNLSDTDSLTKTWKICTKVASFLEQGQRLENLSWRLWHLQNLIVDTDNAKSKREFKKLSKHMGDKLDKEKGRSIEELEAPGFKRNHSTELIKQRALEKERNREASLNSKPGTITRMQFTFSVDQPTPAAMSGPVQKPDLKPSIEFTKRGRRATVPSGGDSGPRDANDKDPPLTHRGRKVSAVNKALRHLETIEPPPAPSLRFPSLFSHDLDPHALLHPTPTRANAVSYGEGVNMNTYNPSDGFSIVRPTIELPLDELLTNAESPGPWSSTASDHEDFDQDVEMKPAYNLYQSDSFNDRNDTPTTPSPFSNLAPLTPLTPAVDELPSISSASSKTGKKPSLSVKTQTSTRSSNVPSATLTTFNPPTPHNSAPGGVKAECSNCGATHTPLWRRGLNDELNCNACGLYCKLHKRPRPKNMRNTQGEGRSQTIPRQETNEIVAQCYNCHTTATPLWRKDDEGKTVCNACGLYYKLHGAARPISMKSDVIRKRSRHDAGRRVGNGPGETPSASPGASRRASPVAEGQPAPQPTLAPDSTTQISYDNETDYRPSSQSELMGALGQDHHHGPFSSQGSYSSSLGFHTFPGPYHPDYLTQHHSAPQDPLPFANDDHSDADSSDYRTNKRRRMSTDSASEPPSSAVSYSSYAESYSTSQTSATSHSQRSSMDFPYNNYSSYGMLRGPSSTFWHPPMLPPDNSPHFIHPPMLPSEESPMDFLHPPMLPHEDEALFATYLHPPMILPDSPPAPMNSIHSHPPMPQSDMKHDHSSYYDSPNVNHNTMQTY